MKDYIAISKYSLASHQREKRYWLTIGMGVGVGLWALAIFFNMPQSPALALIFICGANLLTSYFVKEDKLVIRIDKKDNLLVFKPSDENTILWSASKKELKQVSIDNSQPKKSFLVFKKAHDDYQLDLNKYSLDEESLKELQALPKI